MAKYIMILLITINSTAIIAEELKLDFELTTDTSYLTLTGEL